MEKYYQLRKIVRIAYLLRLHCDYHYTFLDMLETTGYIPGDRTMDPGIYCRVTDFELNKLNPINRILQAEGVETSTIKYQITSGLVTKISCKFCGLEDFHELVFEDNPDGTFIYVDGKIEYVEGENLDGN